MEPDDALIIDRFKESEVKIRALRTKYAILHHVAAFEKAVFWGEAKRPKNERLCNSETPSQSDKGALVAQERLNKTVFRRLSHVPGVFTVLQPDSVPLDREVTGAYFLPAFLSPQEAKAMDALARASATECHTNLSGKIEAKKRVGTRLRWVSLGSVTYNWTTKEYEEGSKNGTLPPLFVRVAQKALSAVEDAANDGSSGADDRTHWDSFEPDCCLINFYRGSDRLRGHQDVSEDNMEAPLICISLGLPAIFLLGGLSRKVNPTPLVLRDGDVLVLRSQARRAFHGIAKLLSYNVEEDVCNAHPGSDYDFEDRISISIRQHRRPARNMDR